MEFKINAFLELGREFSFLEDSFLELWNVYEEMFRFTQGDIARKTLTFMDGVSNISTQILKKD